MTAQDIDSEHPKLQIGTCIFNGTYDHLVDTHAVFTPDQPLR